MIDNPFYNGDYIAQAKAEITHFMAILDSIQKRKTEGLEYDHGNRLSMDVPSFTSYSFHHFKKFTDEKLSSANPIIYIADLDDLLIVADQCISQYCRIIGKTIVETEQFYLSNINVKLFDIKTYIYFNQANFCFQVAKYYKRKRNLLLKNNTEKGEITQQADYILDKNIVIEFLGPALNGANDDIIDFIVSHILFLKYRDLVLSQKYPLFKFKISQNKLCIRLGKLRTRLLFDQDSRSYLANLFSLIPQTEFNGKYTFLTKDSLYRGMNDPLAEKS